MRIAQIKLKGHADLYWKELQRDIDEGEDEDHSVEIDGSKIEG